MEPKEFQLLVSAIRTYYPREKILPNKESMELWYNRLKDLDYQDAANALNRWVSTEKWSPSIADIREAVSEMRRDTVDDWTEGWNQVTRAIGKYGYPDESGALASMDDITRECVKAIGWKNICDSEEIGVERGHFRMMYEQRKERVRKSEVIPDALKNQVELKLASVGKTLALEETRELTN